MAYKPKSQRKPPSVAVFTIKKVEHRHQGDGVKCATLRCTTEVGGVDMPFNVFVNGGNFEAMVPYMYVGRTLRLEGVYSQQNLMVCKKVLEDLTPASLAA